MVYISVKIEKIDDDAEPDIKPTAQTRRNTFKTTAGTALTKRILSIVKTTTESTDLNKHIIKELGNGHSFVQLNRTRVKGFCVECIKSKSDPNYKKTMQKIITYCPTCPGGTWICEPCFDEKHKNI